MNNRNYSIDVLKFICAALVVFLHTKWAFQWEFLPVTRCAVPCFFIISGYLLFDKESNSINPKRLKRVLIRVGKISLWATLLFVVWKELLYAIAHEWHFWLPSIKHIAAWVFLNDNPFGFHLWYLFAYLYVLLLLVVVNKYNKHVETLVFFSAFFTANRPCLWKV